MIRARIFEILVATSILIAPASAFAGITRGTYESENRDFTVCVEDPEVDGIIELRVLNRLVDLLEIESGNLYIDREESFSFDYRRKFLINLVTQESIPLTLKEIRPGTCS
jgi:hypothetical protein